MSSALELKNDFDILQYAIIRFFISYPRIHLAFRGLITKPGEKSGLSPLL
ncbi:MAG: hypothetical protein JW774_13465 [Candidatus Aureabacteria bacterium]|nr:hypothetical protein [Candidatus Auribacterota bacterium]